MCALASLMFGQQQPPARRRRLRRNNNRITAATTAPPEIGKDDPDYGEPIGAVLLAHARATRKAAVRASLAQRYRPGPGSLALPDARPRSPGAFLSIPAGKFNHLEISYFQVDGNGPAMQRCL